MSNEPKNKLREDNRPDYEAPRATRLSDFQTGRGGIGCTVPGSGAQAECSTGTTAGSCFANGNTATTCAPTGGGFNT